MFLRNETNLTSCVVAAKTVCHAALGIFMLTVNRSRDVIRRKDVHSGVTDEETEKRNAEAGGMLDQTEVSHDLTLARLHPNYYPDRLSIVREQGV